MNQQTDAQLLRAYAEHRSDAAFSELVRRHLDFTYSAAVRMVRDRHLAEDVTQGVFVALANNAAKLQDRPVLAGWLHRTAQNIAAQTVRTIERRRAREQEAATMNDLLATESDASWAAVAPHLDTALGDLNEADRDALLLRYFQKKSAQEMAGILGISDEAAQKRVTRAVEHLREHFSKRSVTIGAGGLAVLISANGVQSAPAGLAAAISAAALFTGTAVTASTAIAVTKTIFMTTLQKALVTVTVAALAGTGLYEARQAAQLRRQNQTLQQQQMPLADLNQALRGQLDAATNQLADLLAENARLKSNPNQAELLQLRGQAGQAHTAVQEMAKMKAAAGQNSPLPALFTNAMARGTATAEKFKKNEALAKIARMKEQLHLTDDQAQSITAIMVNQIEASSQQMLKTMSGGQTPAQFPAAQSSSGNEETQIKAVLTPAQLAAYPDFQQAEVVTAAGNAAKSELSAMTAEMDLTPEQQDKIQAALYQYELSQTSSPQNSAAIAQARASGNPADILGLAVNSQQQALDAKLKILDGILSPEQLQTYKQKQTDMIEMQTGAMKMFLPQMTNGVSQ